MDEIARLENMEWQRRQFELEREWAARIMESAAGADRRGVCARAYSAVNELMEQYNDYSISLSVKAMKQKERLCVIGPAKDMKFLEIGCARGDLLELLCRNGWDVYGVDVALEGVMVARQKLQSAGVTDSERKVVVGELRDLNEIDFKLIFHSDVLEHIHPEDVPGFLQQCCERTAPNGQMMIVTPNALVGPSDISRFFVLPGSKAQGLHLKEYTLSELDNLLKQAGYRSIKGFLFHPSSRLCFDKMPRTIYHRIKLYLEKLFVLIPPAFRRKLLHHLMDTMDYACVIAGKQ